MGARQAKAQPNPVLGVAPTSVCQASEDTPVSLRGPVMCTYISLQANPSTEAQGTVFCHVVVAHRKGAEMFCLITGEKRIVRYEPRPHCFILAAARMTSSVNGELLILADTRGRFVALEAASLRPVAEFGGQQMPSSRSGSNPVTVIKRTQEDEIAVGYANGEVKVWKFNSSEPSTIYHSELVGTIGGVRCLEVSLKHSLLFSGHEGSFENEHSRFIKPEHNPVRVMALNSVQVKTLEGMEDTCASLSVIDHKNFLLAGSAVENSVVLWDFISECKLMTIKVPPFGTSHSIVTQVFSLALDEFKDVLVFGLSDGTTLVSSLTLDTGSRKLDWQPLNLINPKRKASISDESLQYIANIQYEKAFDILLLGNAQSELRLINIFLRECFSEYFPKTQPSDKATGPDALKAAVPQLISKSSGESDTNEEASKSLEESVVNPIEQASSGVDEKAGKLKIEETSPKAKAEETKAEEAKSEEVKIEEGKVEEVKA